MKIAMLLSGGVDSSVALRLLLEQGHEVQAFYLKVWLQEELSFIGDCPWEDDLRYARAVCEQLAVPLRIVPLQDAYYRHVVSYALAELREGRTPSPDLFCNSTIKFGAFCHGLDPEFAKVATGHYGRLTFRHGAWRLLRHADPVKDQSYFLARLDQAQLGRIVFPLAPYQKAEVRRLARDFDLPTQDRPDSQGICFLGRIKYREFVRYHLGNAPGEMVEQETGRVLGQHEGLWFYTIGQRSGLGLGGGPWYVVAKDLAANRLVLQHGTAPGPKGHRRFRFDRFHAIVPGEPIPQRLHTKLRHGPRLWDARVRFDDAERGTIELTEPDWGLAPGQMTVLYDGQTCLGSGIIASPV